MASKGHVRDLLVTQISVDVENDFEPTYRVPNDKRSIVKEIKEAAARAEEIFLATDPDREGEAIAWHLQSAAEMPDERIKRVVFHEITKTAINEAFDHPRDINQDLVDAQQARRILDRLVGYNVTQLLWNKVRNRLSAGRVQSIALRMVVDREKEIEAFNAEEYWTIDVELEKQNKEEPTFLARLLKINDEDASLGSESDVQPHLEILEKSLYTIQEIRKGTRQRKPAPPFTTSTLQQEASRRLGFAARRTMRAAQQLYEGIEIEHGDAVGLITYMRTDSVQVSEQAQKEARNFIETKYGAEFIPEKAPIYKTKSKGAQEAHEAIRTTDVLRDPASIKKYLSQDQYRLYKLIWERFVSSQMSNAIYDTIRIDVKAGLNEKDMPYLLRATGSQIQFAGFLAVYEEANDDDSSENDQGKLFPDLEDGESLNRLALFPEQHFTQPPPRFTEASLVRVLEEYGIGRPSTYAPTVAVIQDRDYVNKEDKRLIPTDTGKVVNDLLVEYFPEELDYQFTAKMEDELDSVADGKIDWRPMLHEFYKPFENRLEHARKHMPRIEHEEKVGRNCPECDNELIVRYGRFGKFIGCSNYPECRYTEQFIETTGIECPQCNQGELQVKRTRKGRVFYGCSRYPECDYSTWKLPQTNQDDEKEKSVG
ncbi:type I DNA topoisomerase [Anaerolineales bacterium]